MKLSFFTYRGSESHYLKSEYLADSCFTNVYAGMSVEEEEDVRVAGCSWVCAGAQRTWQKGTQAENRQKVEWNSGRKDKEEEGKHWARVVSGSCGAWHKSWQITKPVEIFRLVFLLFLASVWHESEWGNPRCSRVHRLCSHLGFEPFAHLTLGLWCVVVQWSMSDKEIKDGSLQGNTLLFC